MLHDRNLKLFKRAEGGWITYGDLVNALYRVDANQCEVLLLHTELSFGVPNSSIRRKEFLAILYDLICEMKVPTLVFPSFSFSFSNHEVFDINNTKGRMGALNEYARKLPNAVRSMDPQMSVVVIGDNTTLAKVSGNHSVGTGSIFDNLHHTADVRILFFGPKPSQCFTHMHYVEEQMQVPYRYNMDFSGTIIDTDGRCYKDTYTLFVKYRDIRPEVPALFDEELVSAGILKRLDIGSATIQCFTEVQAYEATHAWLQRDVNGFLAEPYDSHPLVKEYRYGDANWTVTTVQ